MGQVDRFEIVDAQEPIDFEPIVIADVDQVRTLAEGYRDLEWRTVIATPVADPDGYRLRGYSGDQTVFDHSVFASGTFYGEGYSQFRGDALALFEQAIAEHRVNETSE